MSLCKLLPRPPSSQVKLILIFQYAAENTRVDLLDYLASQGIGVSNLK
jgi:hypothetical protein